MAKKSQRSISKSQKDTLSSLMNSIYSSTASFFTEQGGFYGVSTEVGLLIKYQIVGVGVRTYEQYNLFLGAPKIKRKSG